MLLLLKRNLSTLVLKTLLLDDTVLQKLQKVPMLLLYHDDILLRGESLSIPFIGEIVPGLLVNIKT
jgi:hypothetical protein